MTQENVTYTASFSAHCQTCGQTIKECHESMSASDAMLCAHIKADMLRAQLKKAKWQVSFMTVSNVVIIVSCVIRFLV